MHFISHKLHPFEGYHSVSFSNYVGWLHKSGLEHFHLPGMFTDSPCKLISFPDLPRQPSFNCFVFQFYLFSALHINAIKWYVVFCIWFHSLNIMFLSSIYDKPLSGVCHFIAKWYWSIYYSSDQNPDYTSRDSFQCHLHFIKCSKVVLIADHTLRSTGPENVKLWLPTLTYLSTTSHFSSSDKILSPRCPGQGFIPRMLMARVTF